MNEDELLYLRYIIHNIKLSHITRDFPHFYPSYVFRLRKRIETHYETQNWQLIQILAIQDGSVNRNDYILESTIEQATKTSLIMVNMLKNRTLITKEKLDFILKNFIHSIVDTAQNNLQEKLRIKNAHSEDFEVFLKNFLKEFDLLIRRKKALLTYRDLITLSKIRKQFQGKSYMQILYIFSNASYLKNSNLNYKNQLDRLAIEMQKFKEDQISTRQYKAETYYILTEIAVQVQFNLADQICLKHHQCTP